MIDSVDIQNAYNKLYSNLRNCIWPFDTIELIADLEVNCYYTFPNITKVREVFGKLKAAAKEQIRLDDELRASFKKFDALISSDDVVFAKLDKVRETISI